MQHLNKYKQAFEKKVECYRTYYYAEKSKGGTMLGLLETVKDSLKKLKKEKEKIEKIMKN